MDQATYESATPLHLACQAGYDQDDQTPSSPAPDRHCRDAARANASVDRVTVARPRSTSPASESPGIVKLLSYGARRDFPFAGPPYDTAENIAAPRATEILADLVTSRHWTALHHVTILTYKRAFDRCAAAPTSSPPRARRPDAALLAQAAAGSAAKGTIGEGAFLILEAAKPGARRTSSSRRRRARAWSS